MPLPQLQAAAADCGLHLDRVQLQRFATYAYELDVWNQRVNLTAVRGLDAVVRRHFLDSLSCALIWPAGAGSLVDVGSGAGFPGLALKIWRPELQLTMVESVGKKADFLDHIVATLALDGVTVLRQRAEEVGHDPQQRERYDVATARAVAELRVIVEYCLPLLRVGGRLIAPKGPDVQAELAAAAAASALMGGAAPLVHPLNLPGLEARTLVSIDKMAPTPGRFPRAVGVPVRRPPA